MVDHDRDRQEIIDLTVAYCRILDRGDFANLRDLFTPDATAHLGGSGQTGFEEIRERLTSALAPFIRWEHSVERHEVTIDGDIATARCAVHAVHYPPTGSSLANYIVDGTYEDRLVRTPGGWRFAHRSLLKDQP